MSEALKTQKSEAQIRREEKAQLRRNEFLNTLIEAREISPSLLRSDLIDRFQLIPKLDSKHKYIRDSLIHILIGDYGGGGHHLRSIMATNAEGRSYSSVVKDKDIDYEHLKNSQGLKQPGHFRAGSAIIELAKNDKKRDREGVTVFPDSWTAEKVINEVLAVASEVPVSVTAMGSFIHESSIDGVPIRVVTNPTDGKIETAYPI